VTIDAPEASPVMERVAPSEDEATILLATPPPSEPGGEITFAYSGGH